jgi:sec-independent protein translocase protein TatC
MIKDIDESKAPLLEHLVELRKRLIYCLLFVVVTFFVTFYFSQTIYDWLALPLERAMGAKTQLISTEVTGQLWVRVEVAVYSALMIGFPFIANQVWLFVAPGLYKHEKKAVLPFLFLTPVLFTMGVALAYTMMPLALRALLVGPFALDPSGQSLNLAVTPDVQKYLSFVRQILFAFGFSFLLPIALILLNRVGIVSLEALTKGRRYAIVAAFVIAAVVTPPDVFSQLMLAIPLCILYELSIIAIKLMNRSRAKEDAAEKARNEVAESSPAE